MTHQPLATCIIPTCSRSNILPSLVEELERQLEDYPNLYDIVVVGDNVRPNLVSNIAKCVVSEGATGVSSTRNYGAKLADTPWLIFLDDDITPNASWAGILKVFLEKTNYDLAGGRLDIAPASYGDLLPIKYRYLLGEKKYSYQYLRKFDYVAGAHLLIRKSTYEKLGGFPEQWGHKCGEIHLNEDIVLQVLYRLVFDKPIVYLDELMCEHYIRQEQTNQEYLINRLNAQGKADFSLDVNYHPLRMLAKFIYYFLFCLIKKDISEQSLSQLACDYYRRRSYLNAHHAQI